MIYLLRHGLDDETFMNMRMHGHSHVNMGVTPSSTDLNFYKNEILAELNDTDYYIFVIWNKKNEHTVKIYDFGKNILFETADVDVRILNDGMGIEDIVDDANDKLRDKSKVQTSPVVNAATTVAKAAGVPEVQSKYKRKDLSAYDSYYYGYSSYYSDYDDDYNPDYAYHGYGRY